MNTPNDPLTADYDAEDAALREHRREAAKVTRIAILFAVPFILMIVGAIIAFAWSMKRDSQSLVSAPAPAATATAPQTPVSDKDAEIAALRSQIAALQQGQNATGNPATPGAPVYADPNALSLITARLDRIEANQRVLARAAAAANAAAALQQASQGDGPFLAQLATVQASVDDPALIALLRPHAEKGVASEVSLAVEFPQYAARAHIAAASAANKNGLLEKLGQMMNISVRRTDGVDSSTPDGLIFSAETRLNAGDLRGAVAFLNRLPAPAQAVLKPWLDRAQARISVDDATHRLTETALTRLSQSAEAPVEAGGAL